MLESSKEKKDILIITWQASHYISNGFKHHSITFTFFSDGGNSPSILPEYTTLILYANRIGWDSIIEIITRGQILSIILRSEAEGNYQSGRIVRGNNRILIPTRIDSCIIEFENAMICN